MRVSTELNGLINGLVTPGKYFFRVEGTDLLGNPVVIAQSDSATQFVWVNNKIPAFINVSDAPDPFSPFTAEITNISYTITSPSVDLTGYRVTLQIWDVTNTLIATLLDGATTTQTIGSQIITWTGITKTGVYKYEISGYRIKVAGKKEGTPGPNDYATPISGTITVVNGPVTVITQSTDGNLTIYSQPLTSSVTIVQNPFLGSDVTYALGNLSVISPAYNYVVSSFYDITAVTPLVTPTIIALRYPSGLSPDTLKLFRYDETTKGFIAVGRTIVDPINNILYAEVDSLSLFVLMVSEDTVKPAIENLILTPQLVNFSITDDLSGINISSVKIILDGVDITNKMTLSGAMGDLTVSVSGTNLFEPRIEPHTLTIIAQDRGGNEVSKTILFTTGYADVKVVIKPEALNINPGILTAYVKFPQPFGLPIRLEATLDGALCEQWMISYEDMLEEGLTAPIIVMKFRRQDIERALAEHGETIDTDFLLEGRFSDGTALYNFAGRDSITKILK